MLLLITSVFAALLVTAHGCQYPNLTESSFSDHGNIQCLFLDKCKITRLPKGVFLPLPTLSCLYLTQNLISELGNSDFEGLESLHYLNLGQNRLTSLPDDFLHYTPSLRELLLSENPLTQLTGNVLRGSNLNELTIKKNMAPLTLASRALADMSRLTVIKLINCSINTLPADLLDRSNAVKEIDLSENYIQELPEDLFVDKPKLEKLYLNSNKLRSLSSAMFSSLENLKRMSVDMNEISEIDAGIFSSLNKLEILSMRNNRLRSVPADAFPVSLTTLRLDNNELTMLETRLLPAIKKLGLSHNLISSVPQHWSKSLTLESMDLSYNAITSLSEFDMADLSYYPKTTFYLEHNEIRTILVNPNTTGTSALWLEDVPLRCDCLMHRFASHLRNNIFRVQDAYCAEPASLNEIRLKDVKLTDFVCYLEPCPDTCTCVVRPETNALEVKCREQLKEEQVTELETLRQQHYRGITQKTTISYTA